MTEKSSPAISSEIIDSDMMFTFEELCEACNVEAEWIARLVEQGVIEPVGHARTDWQFASLCVVRVAKARRLGRDLDLSPSGLALVLDLLDELDELRLQLGALQTATPAGSQE